jgi:alcohol dehydrogenase class IV
MRFPTTLHNQVTYLDRYPNASDFARTLSLPDRSRLRRRNSPATPENSAAFCGLAEQVGVETRLRQAGVAETDLGRMPADAMKQTRLLVNNPREASEADALAIYRAAWQARGSRQSGKRRRLSS